MVSMNLMEKIEERLAAMVARNPTQVDRRERWQEIAGQPEGLAEAMAFFCERAVGFGNAVGMQHESYFDALVRIFDQACKAVLALPADRAGERWVRLDAVRRLGHNLG
jgi:hypothetical protein